MLGAAHGIGEAFVEALVARHYRVLAVDRDAPGLAELRTRHPAAVLRTYELDLSTDGAVPELSAVADPLSPEIVIVNAASSPLGAFIETPWAEHESVLQLNVGTTLRACHHFGNIMAARGGGGLVLLSSLAGEQGTAGVVSYAASKAFIRVLAEGLWVELGARGVDVLAVVAGATDTPGYRRSGLHRPHIPLMQPERLAELSLRHLGRGPVFVPGWANRLSFWSMSLLLPKRVRLRVMAAATGVDLRPDTGGQVGD